MDLWENSDTFIIKEEIVCKSECEVIIDVLEDNVNINPVVDYPDDFNPEPSHNFEDSLTKIKHKIPRTKTLMRYGCMICSYKTGNSTNFKIHLRTHTGERPYKCDQCSYSAKVLCALYRHKRVHTGERPYACAECSYRAAQPSHLARHKMIHTGERPHSCNQCSYSASQMSHLVRHMSVHNNYRPFPCNECPYRAKRKSHLQKHLTTHEKERQNSYACTRELRSINRTPLKYCEDDYEYIANISSYCKFCSDDRLEFKKERKNKLVEGEDTNDSLNYEEENHPTDFVQININDEENSNVKPLELANEKPQNDV